MNQKEKERYKKKLLEKKNEVSDKVVEFYAESKEVESGIAQDIADKAESSYTKEFLLSLSDSEREQMFLVDDALERIEKCEYGICQMCEKKISTKRLNAVPWTRYCIICQQKEEEDSP
ncbi:TraR/DksA family transcriptional regulator [Acidobacteriota bacterium]